MTENSKNFSGLHVLSLESRMAGSAKKLIEKFGGVAHIAPSLKEIPIEDNPEAFAFFEELEKGVYDLLILMTGVGTRVLLNVLQSRFPKERILCAFEKTRVVVRGPKPLSVCKMNNIPIAVTVPAPNTWQEILTILKEENLLNGKKVALLEYGRSDTHFLAELTGQGAVVTPVHAYHWALPDDTKPLRQAVEDLLDGKIDLILQTSAVQIDHLFKMLKNPAEELALRRALQRVGIFSIGPTTSSHLRELQLFPDYEATPNKIESLVEQATERAEEILQRKRNRANDAQVRVINRVINIDKSSLSLPPKLIDSPMLRACRLEQNERVPIWLMRQAGRYMQEYQLVRQNVDFLTLCKTPELAAQVTLDAVERLGVDAAIIFSDILIIVEAMGLPLEFRESTGPLISQPVRSREAIQKLRNVEVQQSLGFVLEAIRQVRSCMDIRIPLIGFAGAPFTVAAYMIEGKGSRNYVPTKILMHEDPVAWHELLEKITTATIDYLKAQVEAGCQILQLFDSWVGCLSPADYRSFVFPHVKRLFEELPSSIPTVHFGTGTATLLSLMKEAGGNIIGLDWRQEISSTWNELGSQVGVQGNLDPTLLFCKPRVFLQEAQRILESVGSRPGFIFNLGHGILPETPVDHVMALVDYVRSWRA